MGYYTCATSPSHPMRKNKTTKNFGVNPGSSSYEINPICRQIDTFTLIFCLSYH